eukprot:1374750-Prymnesium_polylepis.1
MAELMQANGQQMHKDGGSGIPANWTVTLDCVLQWIGVWMYMLAFHQPGDRSAFWREPTAGY